MKGFKNRATVEEVQNWIAAFDLRSKKELVSLSELTCDSTVASDVVSKVNVPSFRRAMMDGFALQSGDVQGASNYNQIELNIIGEILPGQPFSGEVRAGTAVRIMTGAEVPSGADAVLPVEKTENKTDDSVSAIEPIASQKNIGFVGEDVAEGDVVLSAGRKLRPQDIAILSSIGCSEVEVFSKPNVRVLVSGNELLPPGSIPKANQITDSNSPMLDALIRRDGGVANNPGIVPDSESAIRDAMLDDEADLIVVAGGSSVGKEDFAPIILRELGELKFHGIAMRPSSPTGVGTINGKLVFLLPGNPVSCLCAYDFFARSAVQRLAGRKSQWTYCKRIARLKSKLSSAIGRVDYARVRFIDDQWVEPVAISGASVLSSTTNADGFAIIPASSEGFAAESEIEVFAY